MKFIYSDNPKHIAIDLEEVRKIYIDNDGDLRFELKDGTSPYWAFTNAEEVKKVRQDILDYVEAHNVSNMIKIQ